MLRLGQSQSQDGPLLSRLWRRRPKRPKEHGSERARRCGEQCADTVEFLGRAVLALDADDNVGKIRQVRVQILQRRADLTLLAPHEGHGDLGSKLLVSGSEQSAALGRASLHFEARGDRRTAAPAHTRTRTVCQAWAPRGGGQRLDGRCLPVCPLETLASLELVLCPFRASTETDALAFARGSTCTRDAAATHTPRAHAPLVYNCISHVAQCSCPAAAPPDSGHRAQLLPSNQYPRPPTRASAASPPRVAHRTSHVPARTAAHHYHLSVRAQPLRVSPRWRRARGHAPPA